MFLCGLNRGRSPAVSDNLGWTDKMGPLLRAEVTRQLLIDLKHYGVEEENLVIDWSETVIEGHQIFYLDGSMENWSGIGVDTADGKPIAGGWMEFLFVKPDYLYIYWDLLDLYRDGKWHKVKKFGLPTHIWDTLPDDHKDQIALSGIMPRESLIMQWKRTRKLY
jgi:hypothetical protein